MRVHFNFKVLVIIIEEEGLDNLRMSSKFLLRFHFFLDLGPGSELYKGKES